MLERIRAISQMLSSEHFTAAEIAQATNVAKGTVSQIISRERHEGRIMAVGRLLTRNNVPGPKEVKYRIVEGGPRHELTAQIDEAMSTIRPVQPDWPISVPDALLIAEDKLTVGLRMSLEEMTSARPGYELDEAWGEFKHFVCSISEDLGTLESLRLAEMARVRHHVVTQTVSHIRSVIDKYVAGDGTGVLDYAKVAVALGSAYGTSLTVGQDPTFACSASLRVAGQIASQIAEELPQTFTFDDSLAEGMALANRFLTVATHGVTSKLWGVLKIQGIGENALVNAVGNTLTTVAGMRIVDSTYAGPDPSVQVYVVGALSDRNAAANVLKMVKGRMRAATPICLLDESGHLGALRDFSTISYVSLHDSHHTQSVNISRFFEGIEAIWSAYSSLPYFSSLVRRKDASSLRNIIKVQD